MPYVVKASSREHLASLLRLVEEHDCYADSVDLTTNSFFIQQVSYWLWNDLDINKAFFEPPMVWR